VNVSVRAGPGPAAAVAEVAATNHVHVQVTQRGKEGGGRAGPGHLVKGAAGQAIQNMNWPSVFPETAGLTHPGAFPAEPFTALARLCATAAHADRRARRRGF
jgi:N-acetyl-gamma-glutamylphosphate reductase